MRLRTTDKYDYAIARGIAVILMFAMILIANVATSKTLTPGTQVAINGTVLCDTEEQINSILEAQQINFMAGYQTVIGFSQMKNERGEPACVIVPSNRGVLVVIGEKMGTFENVYAPNGETDTVHVVAVLWHAADGLWYTGFIITTIPVGEQELGQAL